MARTLSRWGIALLLACAAIAIAMLPPPEKVGDPWVPYWRGYGELEWRVGPQYEQAINTLRFELVRDSLLALAELQPGNSSDSLVLLFGPRVPDRERRVIEAWLRPTWFRTLPHSSEVQLATVVMIDTDSVVAGLPRPPTYWSDVHYLLPPSSEGRACISLIQFGLSTLERIETGGALTSYQAETVRDNGLGSCAFYGAFGLPGGDVADWLSTWQYAPIADANWESAFSFRGQWQWSGRGWFSGHLEFVSCAGGDRESCGRIVRREPGEERRFRPARFLGPGLQTAERYYTRWSQDALGPWVNHYFADMVAYFGRDRFAEFWRSEEPIEQGFELAMGVPLDEWTMQWVQAYVGVPRTTNRLPVGSAVLSLILVGVLVGSAGLYARRRQVI